MGGRNEHHDKNEIKAGISPIGGKDKSFDREMRQGHGFKEDTAKREEPIVYGRHSKVNGLHPQANFGHYNTDKHDYHQYDTKKSQSRPRNRYTEGSSGRNDDSPGCQNSSKALTKQKTGEPDAVEMTISD